MYSCIPNISFSHVTVRLSNNSHLTPQNESCWCQCAPVIVPPPPPYSLCFCIAVSEAVRRAYAPCVITGLRLSSPAPLCTDHQPTHRVTRHTLPLSSHFTFWAVVPWHWLSWRLYAAADSDGKVLLCPLLRFWGLKMHPGRWWYASQFKTAVRRLHAGEEIYFLSQW